MPGIRRLTATAVIHEWSRFSAKTLLIVPALALGMAGCLVAGDGDHARMVQMPVEEILASESVHAGAPLEVRFVGVLTNGCQRFERLEVDETDRSATVLMWAREPRQTRVVCTADIRHVQHARTFQPGIPGTFTITVKQPDGSERTSEVRIE